MNSHILAITIRQSSCSLFEASTLTGTRRRHARKAFLFSLGPRIGRAEAHKPGSSFTRCKSYEFLAISFLEMKKGTRLSFSPPAASSRSRQRGDPRRAAHTPPRRAGQPHTVFSPCTVRIAFSHPKSWLVKHDGCDDTSVPARSRPAARLFTTCGYRSHRRSHHNPPSIDTLTVSLPHRIPRPCTPV